MVYLAIKELCPFAEDIIMVTASIMKDMQPNMEVIYRPNAIRALSRVVDVSVLERPFGPWLSFLSPLESYPDLDPDSLNLSLFSRQWSKD